MADQDIGRRRADGIQRRPQIDQVLVGCTRERAGIADTKTGSIVGYDLGELRDGRLDATPLERPAAQAVRQHNRWPAVPIAGRVHVESSPSTDPRRRLRAGINLQVGFDHGKSFAPEATWGMSMGKGRRGGCLRVPKLRCASTPKVSTCQPRPPILRSIGRVNA